MNDKHEAQADNKQPLVTMEELLGVTDDQLFNNDSTAPVKLTPNGYVVSDVTDGGYTFRDRRVNVWSSTWCAPTDDRPRAITLGGDDVLATAEDHESHDFHAVRCAIARHRRLLREHLGLQQPVDVKVHFKPTAVLDRRDDSLQAITVSDCKVTPKQVDDGLTRTSRKLVYVTAADEATLVKVNAYNEFVAEAKAERLRLLKAIFGDQVSGGGE